MENKEIDSFFRNRKQVFEEVPDNALWNKIEGRLNARPASRTKTTTVLLIIAAIFVTALIGSMLLKDNPVEKPELHSKPVEIETATEKTAILKVNDTIKKKRKSEATATVAFTGIVKPALAILPPTSAQNAPLPDSTVYYLPGIATKTRTYPGRIIIETKGQLTATQFETLVNQALKDNTGATGTILIVKAPGFKPYRKVIAATQNPFTLKSQEASLKNDVIQFHPINEKRLKEHAAFGDTLKSGEFIRILVPKDSIFSIPGYPETAPETKKRIH